MTNQDHMKIVFSEPAKRWEEALPVGNGRLGGMVFGLPFIERFQLNEDSVWSGGPMDRNNPSAKEALPKIRKLIFEGKIAEAEELCAFALSGTPEEERHYEPLGNLFIEFCGRDTEYSGYHRELDIQHAVATTEFIMNEVRYRREVICSYPRNAMIIHLTADRPGMLNFQAQLGRGGKPWEEIPYQMQTIRKQAYNNNVDRISARDGNVQLMEASTGGPDGIRMACAVKVISLGGTSEVIGNSTLIRNADEAVLILCADTTFREEDPAASVLSRLDRVASCGEPGKVWEILRNEHLADYSGLFNTVTLEIDGQEDIVRFFQFGRYLMISGSRPGSLPLNLQGIWNPDYIPMWGSRFTININTEMNYWPAMVTNLAECAEPLIDHIERMRKNGRNTAEKMYGCRGFCAHHNTDIWGDTAPQDVCLSSSYWVMGAAWLCLHIWEQYLFTKDEVFLKKHYPAMSEAATFVMDYLVEDGEFLVTCPTLSPENTYILPTGEKGVICKGASMDNQIITELLTACIRAEKSSIRMNVRISTTIYLTAQRLCCRALRRSGSGSTDRSWSGMKTTKKPNRGTATSLNCSHFTPEHRSVRTRHRSFLKRQKRPSKEDCLSEEAIPAGAGRGSSICMPAWEKEILPMRIFARSLRHRHFPTFLTIILRFRSTGTSARLLALRKCWCRAMRRK
ncbi:MAG: glycoside hydrolase family 95 protein [Clostridiales bacterium]|nr:glycoside hydrolase family 95 protein [Clostridiales bacterium]